MQKAAHVRARDEGGWVVVDNEGSVIAGPFDRNADAWRWIDRHDAQATNEAGRAREIGSHIGQW